MSKKIQTLLVSVSILGLVVFIGCSSVQDLIIPSYISPAAIDYVDANVPILTPYTSLFDAKTIDRKMDYVHLLNSMTEEARYKFLKSELAFHIGVSEEFQQAIFSPEGPIGLLFPTLLGGSLGALLIKRPGDKSKKELEE